MQAKFTAAILALLMCAGCATDYQARGIMGGFSETQLAPDIIRIKFLGNSSTRPERAQDFALLRAAELSLENGYPDFIVLNETNETHQSTFNTAGSAQTIGTIRTNANQASYTAQTTDQPGQTLIVKNPEAGVLIRLLKEKHETAVTYDAAFLVRNLKSKYQIK